MSREIPVKADVIVGLIESMKSMLKTMPEVVRLVKFLLWGTMINAFGLLVMVIALIGVANNG